MYASFGTSGGEQARYGEGHWYDEEGADFGGLCIVLPVVMSHNGLMQKPLGESLVQLGTEYMEMHTASPTLFMPATRAAWMTPDNTELLWRVRRFSEANHIESCWRMIRPTEWRVTPIRYASWTRFAGWTE